MHIAEGEDRIVKAAALDQRHAQLVAADAGAAGQAVERLDALARRHAAGIAAVEQRLAARKAQTADKEGGEAGEGQGAEASAGHGHLGVGRGRRISAAARSGAAAGKWTAQAPWHFLNFFWLPQGQGSLRPTSFSGLRTGSWCPWLQCGP